MSVHEILMLIVFVLDLDRIVAFLSFARLKVLRKKHLFGKLYQITTTVRMVS